MPAYGFPTTTEVTTLEGTTISTTVNNGYNFITGEKPVPSSKFRGLVKAVKDITAYIKADNESELTPTLQNSWVAFGAGYQVPRYYKDKNNIVHLYGMVGGGTSASLGTVILTLPVGYRPAYEFPFAATGWDGTGTADQYVGVRVATNGQLKLYRTGISWFCFDCSFKAA